MTQVETLSPDKNLTGVSKVQSDTQESNLKTTEPAKESENWQVALQKARERENAEREAREEAESRLKEIEDQEKRKRLENMSEVDKYKSLAEEEAQKRANLELKLIVKDSLVGKDIPTAIVELISETPWAIPAVKRELGSEFTWDQAVASVKKHLPGYIDSLTVVKANSPLDEEPSKKVDSERSVGSDVVREHIYTQEEVEKISKEPAEWEKHRTSILSQMAKYGGALPK